MVQRKTVQKPKTNTLSKEPITAAVVSNGFGDNKSKDIQIKKDTVKKLPTKSAKKVTDAVHINNNGEAELNGTDETKPSTSKGMKETNEMEHRNSDERMEEDAKETTKEVKVVKSRKRKQPLEEEPQSSNKEMPTIKSRAKAKKQKIVLDVPHLKSIPGKVFVVGDNETGQLGLDEEIDSKGRPFLLDFPYNIIDIAAGAMHSVCLTENGEVITFGCNDEGALGRNASDEEERIPQKVDLPEKIVQISAGDSHSAALSDSGKVYLWGNFRNSNGQMGLTADGKKSITPVRILSNETIVKISSGGDHLVCLSKDGVAYTCGCSEQGQLGRIPPKSCQTGGRKGLSTLLTPSAVDRLKPSNVKINDIWTESYATFMKAHETGSIYAFGLNNYGQLGIVNESTEMESQTKCFPELITSFNSKEWQQINGGQHHTLALDSDGLVYALGRKDYGRLGLGPDCQDTAAPSVIPTLGNTRCVNVSCGNCVSYAVTEQGSLHSWGMSSSQLGHGSRNDDDILEPRQIGGDFLNSWDVHKVAGGGQHALILACPKKSANKSKDSS